MDQCNLLELLGQVDAGATGKVFREFLRGGARLMLANVMAEEVSGLCGAKYHPADEAAFQRAGSEQAAPRARSSGKDAEKPCGVREFVEKPTAAAPRKFRWKPIGRPGSRTNCTRRFFVRWSRA